jgi:hypothetical protein
VRAFSALFSSGLLHDQVGQATKNEDGRNGPQNEDWHGSSPQLPLSERKLKEVRRSSAILLAAG